MGGSRAPTSFVFSGGWGRALVACVALAGSAACKSAQPLSIPSDAGATDATTNPAANDVPADSECTISPQSGCPPEHTCALAGSAGVNSCFGAGSVPPGDLCTQFFDCAAGDICLYGSCNAVCTRDQDCTYPGSRCIQPVDQNNMPVLGTQACSTQCNPANPSDSAGFRPCGAELACYFEGPIGATACETAGVTGPGEPCKLVTDCAPGLTCLNGGSTATCTQMCLMGASSGCASGSCRSFGMMLFVDKASAMIEVGYCG